MWSSICTALNLPETKPISLTRLTRHTSSPSAGKPRLLRVDLQPGPAMEDVLLSAHLLRNNASLGIYQIRIFPDIPWTKRAARRQQLTPPTQPCSIIVHGVPELHALDATLQQRQQHDCNQWRFLQQTLNIVNVITTDVHRLPRPASYTGTAPHLLKVTFLTA
ncbi:unnamed protein product, partial [Dicrocoelium dendriticum]